MPAHADRIADTIDALLQARAPTATICPSEVARAIDPLRWRPLMDDVRAVAATMAAAGEVELRQGGVAISPFAVVRGPLRIARGDQKWSLDVAASDDSQR